MPTGNVVYINSKRGMFVVQLENGSYSVLEMFDSYNIEMGEEIKGHIDDEGSCIVYSIDNDESFDVIVQNAGCNRDHAMRRASL